MERILYADLYSANCQATITFEAETLAELAALVQEELEAGIVWVYNEQGFRAGWIRKDSWSYV